MFNHNVLLHKTTQLPMGKHLNRQDFLQNLNSLFPYVGTSADIIKMGESSTNVLNLSESALNSLKKLDLVQKILDLKGKVIVDTDLHKLSDQIHKLTEMIDQISTENRKLTSELVIIKNVNSRLEERIINLEKNQAKGEQNSRRNNVELSGILNSICDEDLENTTINICKESGIDADTRDIEGCHQLPLSRNSRGHNKRVIVKFVNRKYAEALLKDKKQISSKNFGCLHVTNEVFVSVSLCPYLDYLPIHRFIWGKCEDLQRQGKVHHVFCLGSIVCIKLSENGSPVKLHHISDIPNFPSDLDIEK